MSRPKPIRGKQLGLGGVVLSLEPPCISTNGLLKKTKAGITLTMLLVARRGCRNGPRSHSIKALIHAVLICSHLNSSARKRL